LILQNKIVGLAMDIERGFKFVFQEKNWFGKIVVGGLMILFSFLVIPLLIYYGYLVEVAMRTIRGEEQLLPEWDNIGRKMANGFKLFVIVLIYLIPFFVLFIFPMLSVNFEFDGMKSREIVASAGKLSGESLLLFILSFVYLIFFALIFPFIVGKFSENESINDAFAISDIFSMFRDNIGDAVIVFLLTVFVQLLASLGFVLCFVGLLLTAFWANIVQYYLYGELYRKSLKARETSTI